MPSSSFFPSPPPQGLETLVARFEAAWLRGERVDIDALLSNLTGESQTAVLAELANIELELRLKAGEPARVEDYLKRYPELAGYGTAVLDLIATECRQRRRHELDLRMEEYYRRFPTLDTELRARQGSLFTDDSTDEKPVVSDRGALVLQPGMRPLPEYELVRKLGEGGFGEVWQARGPGGLDAALKFVKVEARGGALELRALELMKSVRHPNLVSLFGAWHKDKLLILAMELCDRTLQQCLQQALAHHLPGIPIKELFHYMHGAAEGLDALHEQHVQHRDIKPGNLLLLHNGVKVADFGLAKILAQSVASHTGAMTVAYAPPEFFKGEVTKYSDQYSLAATYYQLRTGRLLFNGTFHQMAYGHMNVTPDLSNLPAAERAVVAKALAKEPAQRWCNCTAFVNGLLNAHQEMPAAPAANETAVPTVCQERHARPPAEPFKQAPILSSSVTTETAKNAAELTKLAKRRKRLPLWLRGSLLLLACLGGGVGLWGLGSGWSMVEQVLTTKESDAPVQPNELPQTLTLDLGGRVTMAFVLIPKGKFLMGSPKAEDGRQDDEELHEVEISEPFYLAKFLVTQQQYAKLIGKNPNSFRKGGQGEEALHDVVDENTSQFPVERVSWYDADTFCKELMATYSEQMPSALRQQHYGFALPTEAQWEYACRAGTMTPFSFGSILNGKQANCNGNNPYGTDEKGPNKGRTTKGGEYGENPWGLCDMYGNVWQWCEDYHSPYEGLPIKDPVQNVKYKYYDGCILRGGSYLDNPETCRAAKRGWCMPEKAFASIGFRVAFRPMAEPNTSPTPPSYTPPKPPLSVPVDLGGGVPATVAVDLGDGMQMEFVFIDPHTKPDGGKFKMGSPPNEAWHNPFENRFDAEKEHDVQLTKPYYLAKYPVTQQQYAKLVGSNPSHFRKGGGGEGALKDVPDMDTSQFPVERVTWKEANDFCKVQMKKYNEQMPDLLGKQNYCYALPTEAQWEYACRAGTTTPFSFGAVLNGQQANCNGTVPYGTEEKGPYLQRTTKVGSYGANPWGLCDMHGNVFQWCADHYGPYEELPDKDPLQLKCPCGTNRVHRGGSCLNHAWICRAACRPNQPPTARQPAFGFRVAFRQD